MSKNKRAFRAVLAGLFFAGLGLLGTFTYDGSVSPPIGRKPATTTCIACSDLLRMKAELLALPGPDTVRVRKKKAEIEMRDNGMLKTAGGLIADLWRDGELSSEELQAVAIYLVETRDRDGAGVILNLLADQNEVDRMSKMLGAIDAEIVSLTRQNVFSVKAAEAYRATIAAFLAQGEPGAN